MIFKLRGRVDIAASQALSSIVGYETTHFDRFVPGSSYFLLPSESSLVISSVTRHVIGRRMLTISCDAKIILSLIAGAEG
jgi:hypothetical protein